MTLLITGLVIFFAIHLATAARGLRSGLIARFGEIAYKGVYSLISLAAFVLIVRGFGAATDAGLYTPPAWGRPVTLVLVLLGFISLAGYRLKGHIKAKLRHPMLVGVGAWAVAHLLANGDRAGVVLFGSFLLYSIVVIMLANRRGPARGFTPKSVHDVVAVVAGVAVFGVVAYFHGSLFGRALI